MTCPDLAICVDCIRECLAEAAGHWDPTIDYLRTFARRRHALATPVQGYTASYKVMHESGRVSWYVLHARSGSWACVWEEVRAHKVGCG